jgi:hypothetical protein
VPTRDKPPTSSFHKWVHPGGEPYARFVRTGDGYHIRFPGQADFHLSGEGEVLSCSPYPGASPETIRNLERNHVRPLALSRQANLVFHASAAEVRGEGLAFAGKSGRGKSTLAAELATSGGRLLADDGLVIEKGTSGFEVLPSDPSVRLWRDSARALFGSAAAGVGTAEAAKVRLPAGGRLSFCAERRPLGRLYVLGDGSSKEIAIEELKGGDAVVELLKHSFLLDVDRREAVASHFDRLTLLVRSSCLYRLDFPRRFESLESVRRAVLDHRPAWDATGPGGLTPGP